LRSERVLFFNRGRIAYKRAISDYRVNKPYYYENTTENEHSINIGFTFYFEKGFLKE
jgi:hypothetical protein